MAPIPGELRVTVPDHRKGAAPVADTSAIPAFDDSGNLPPGVHPAKLSDVGTRLTWTTRRRQLFDGLTRAIANLASAGVRKVWIDGSFATAKDEPADIDGCWEYCAGVDLEKLDAAFLDLSPPREAMKREYGVDFLIAHARPQNARNRSVIEFFQLDRDGKPKGIVLLEIGDQP